MINPERSPGASRRHLEALAPIDIIIMHTFANQTRGRRVNGDQVELQKYTVIKWTKNERVKN